jgi:hypothetical protein
MIKTKIKFNLIFSIVIFLVWIILTIVFLRKIFSTNKEERIKIKETKITDFASEKSGNSAGTFVDDFSEEKIIIETDSPAKSTDQNWWLNSGAIFKTERGVGKTLFGSLKQDDYWRKNYADYNPDETTGGYRPQNIFRLVTKKRWRNFRQEAYFKVKYYEQSPSQHRQASNGLFLFNRYQDGDNLYYTGLRVDGQMVVKKKYNGQYHTMISKKVLSGKYDRENNPILIPLDKWIGLGSEVTNEGDKVIIKVFLDQEGSGHWREIVRVEDDGVRYHSPLINSAGFAGLRTDFMDCEFDDYLITDLFHKN